MFSSKPPPIFETEQPFSTWQELCNWARSHCRQRIFQKDQQIPARPGLLYLVTQGAVRLMGCSPLKEEQPSLEKEITEAIFLGIIGIGQPFEITEHPQSIIHAYAHLEKTSVIWFYWHELAASLTWYIKVLEMFRQQHQRKLLWMSIMAQKRTVDRLIGFFTLLALEEGEGTEKGYYLPYPLTQAQIASAIGTTRVTVTRLMGKLRQEGLIEIQEDNRICWKIK
ncbi:Crp/Fnr family transcriptional regulator [Crocosphaera sp. UHCC 0190]|uniref:Crp/Fnr family transcriptional regulator n=1 Tax=Crocosphaera sp. UHCC 0190 TaxID=3110246 RepID=UPI002B1F1CD8|nr:Crp/Fnr family transcriptional regulator [Crocosphaera sp. UHCC 0190]MEA5508940.1 Crp/Fnr family transcriptional regulator [Crocosphaera sp. UHCC 0190]